MKIMRLLAATAALLVSLGAGVQAQTTLRGHAFRIGNAHFWLGIAVAIIVVKGFVHYISRHGFAPFAWYRIAAGLLALVWLTMR